jgi:hypothetical protein
MVLVLTGVSGSGKSTIALELHRVLGWPFQGAGSCASIFWTLEVCLWHFCDFARHSSMVGTQVNCRHPAGTFRLVYLVY